VIEIDPGAQVTLTTFPYADPSAPKVVSLGQIPPACPVPT
jgi:hypothetical protein